jgi:hypothetical protein
VDGLCELSGARQGQQRGWRRIRQLLSCAFARSPGARSYAWVRLASFCDSAQRDTSLSALVVSYLEQVSGRMDEFTRLEALQREVQAEIGRFRAADRLSRDEVHDRAVR